MQRRRLNIWGLLALSLFSITLLACRQASMPPDPYTLTGTLDERARFHLFYWEEGLKILLWDDLPLGAHSQGSSSDSSDPYLHLDGGGYVENNRGYEYTIDVRDGIEAEMTIDNRAYNLADGTVFLIQTAGISNKVTQLDLNLDDLEPNEEWIESLGRSQPQISGFISQLPLNGEPTPTPVQAIAQPDEVNPTTTPSPPTETPPQPTATPLPPTMPAPQPTRDTRSGNPIVDTVIELILTNDGDSRRQMIRFSTAGCTTVQGLGGPPMCGPDQEEGTLVEYFPVRITPGEGQAVRPDEMESVLDFEVIELYAAYTQAEKSRFDDFSLPAVYAAVFSTKVFEELDTYIIFHLDNDGFIVMVDALTCPLDKFGNPPPPEVLACTPESIIERDAIDILVPPPQVSGQVGMREPNAGTDLGPAQPTVPGPMTPTPTPELFSAQLERPLFIRTMQLPTSSAIGGPHSLWVLEPGSRQAKRLTPTVANVTAVDIQEGDGRLAYATSDAEIFVLEPQGSTRLLYRVDQTGDSQIMISSLSWSPNSQLLAFTSSQRDGQSDGSQGGLWVLDLGDGRVTQLLSNRYLLPGEDDVSIYREFIKADFSPDGSALLLMASFWDYSDILWMQPLGADPTESNVHDPQGNWRYGVWNEAGDSILLAGWFYSEFSDMAIVNVDEQRQRTLIDGQELGLYISYPEEIEAGIAFLASSPTEGEPLPGDQLYIGQLHGGGFDFNPSGVELSVCGSSFLTSLTWDKDRNLAAVACPDGAEIISLDGSFYLNLSPFLGPLPENTSLQLIWGS